MSKLKTPIFSLMAQGGLTKGLTFLRRHKTHIVEETPYPPDVKSLAQLSWRTMFQKAIALWHALSVDERQQWESAARPYHMTGYAYFISQTLRPNPGIYLPLAGGIMQGDVGMATHAITDLPDPTNPQDPVTLNYFDNNIPIGGYTEGCRCFNSANQLIGSGAWVALDFDSEHWDTDSMHDPIGAPAIIYCKTPGKYLVSANVQFAPHNAGFRGLLLRLGTGQGIGEQYTTAIQGANTSISLSSVWDFALNESVRLHVYQNSGANLNVLASTWLSPELAMQRIG